MVCEVREGTFLCSRGKRKATRSTLLAKVLKVAMAYNCDACAEGMDVVFVRPASATNKLAKLKLRIEPQGIALVGSYKPVPKHIVRMVLAMLDDEFGLMPSAEVILRRLRNGKS